MYITNVRAKAFADAWVAALDAGTQAVLRIYSGTVPADADAALGSPTLLAELTFSATSFGAATDANPGGRVTANAITSDSSADNSGTPTFYRALTQTSSGVVEGQGTAGISGAELNTGSAISAGATVAMSSATVTVVEGP